MTPVASAPLRSFSFGGGVQSTAALVLAAQGRIDYRTFVFANVGEDSENPGTITYVEKHTRPYAEAHGLTLIELDRVKRDGSTEVVDNGLIITVPSIRCLVQLPYLSFQAA